MGVVRVGETFQRSTKAVWHHLNPFLRTQGVVVLLVAVATSVLLFVVGDIGAAFVAPDGTATGADGLRAFFTPTRIALLVIVYGAILLASPLGSALGMVLTARILDGQGRIGVGQVWAAAVRAYGNLLRTNLWMFVAFLAPLVAAGGILALGLAMHQMLLIFLAVLLLVAGAVVVLVLVVRWMLVAPVSVFEHRRPLDNLRRARALARGHYLDVFFALLVVILLGAGIGVLANLPYTIYTRSQMVGVWDRVHPARTPLAFALRIVGQTISQLATGFLSSAALTVIYRRLAVPPAGAAPTPTPIPSPT
jgi:hypothetical protein